jgi:hypothetical protein
VFFSVCVLIMSVVSGMVLYLCSVFYMSFEYPELLLLIACICSFYPVWNAWPVCRVYFSGQFRHFIW